MNPHFISWLAARAGRTLFCDYQWIKNYRKFILNEKMLSIFVTILLGIAFVLVTTLTAMVLVKSFYTGTSDEKFMLITSIMQWLCCVPPVFFVYNWIMALYGVYTKEQEEMWKQLKEDR